MSDDSSDSDDEGTFFQRVEPTVPICLGVDSNFCQLLFKIKHYGGHEDIVLLGLVIPCKYLKSLIIILPKEIPGVNFIL